MAVERETVEPRPCTGLLTQPVRGITFGVGSDAMPHITLAVTQPVIQQVQAGNDYQRQLAVQGASPDLIELLNTASADNQVLVAVCGVFSLSVGDTRAIWGSHQAAGHQADDFANLYALLARRPNVPVTFRW
jgi:hypothetical protein